MANPDVDPTLGAAARHQAFLALRAAMPAANMRAALQCSARLQAALPHAELAGNLVLVAYGGGKDSSYTLAFVRAMQLILFRVYGTTFRLRAATNRHAGMPKAVLENVHREYQALRLYDDPYCEMLLIDGDEVAPFDVDTPQREHVVRRNRLDILMTGHRTFADGRPTFCNACNLSVFNSFGLAAGYGEGADLIITGDSAQEQRQYLLWVGRLAQRIGSAAEKPTNRRGAGRLLAQLDRIARSYFTDIHGADAAELIAERRVHADVPERLRFFSIYADTQYAAGDHLALLTDFLGFQFDDMAFSFTESDCGNPALMAHLRGLKCERVYRRSYAEGIAEYVDFATGLMRKKDFPDELVELMRSRYAGPGAVTEMRRVANDYAMETFGLTEEQLICMAYSPFAEKGAGLDEYLRREHPALAGRAGDIHQLLAAEPAAGLAAEPGLTAEPVAATEPGLAAEQAAEQAAGLAAELLRFSGLDLPQLRLLYRSPVRRPDGRGTEVIDAVLVGDPHKAVIRTRHAPDGPSMLEEISGR